MADYFDKYTQVKLNPVIIATVVTGGSTTTFTASSTASLSTTDNTYVGDTVEFTSGAVIGLTSRISSYTASTNTFIIDSVGISIANGVTFKLYNTALIQDGLHNQPFSDLSIVIQPTDITYYTYYILYGDTVRETFTISGTNGMVTYTDRTQIFPANQINSNWARQQRGEYMIGYPVYAKIIHKGTTTVLYKVSIVSTTQSSIV